MTTPVSFLPCALSNPWCRINGKLFGNGSSSRIIGRTRRWFVNRRIERTRWLSIPAEEKRPISPVWSEVSMWWSGDNLIRTSTWHAEKQGKIYKFLKWHSSSSAKPPFYSGTSAKANYERDGIQTKPSPSMAIFFRFSRHRSESHEYLHILYLARAKRIGHKQEVTVL